VQEIVNEVIGNRGLGGRVYAPSTPPQKSPSQGGMDAYLTKKPIKFVGFLATFISEIVTISAQETVSPMRKVKFPNSLPALRA